MYGDQKTVARLRSIKARRAIDTDPYESLQWLLPVPALFHLKMNWVGLIHRTHFLEKYSKSPFSLAYTRDLLNRKRVNQYKSDFFALEEFVVHNFQGRIIAAIQSELKLETEMSFRQLLQALTPEALDRAINCVADRLFATPLSEITDNELYNHIHFLQMSLTYLTLKYAIKHGDLCLLRRAITKSCFYFGGSMQRNYAYETLYLFHLTCGEASSPELQKAILASGLINWRGKCDTWWEIDREVEIHNGSMKKIIRDRRTPNMNLDHLFEYCALNSEFYKNLQISLYNRFGLRTNTTHPDKPASYDILTIASHVYESMQPTHQGKSPYRVKDLLFAAAGKLGIAIHKFNQKERLCFKTTEAEAYAENSALENLFEWDDE